MFAIFQIIRQPLYLLYLSYKYLYLKLMHYKHTMVSTVNIKYKHNIMKEYYINKTSRFFLDKGKFSAVHNYLL